VSQAVDTVLHTEIAGWLAQRATWAKGASVGFVPTMGALHEGHASLLRRARAENDFVVLSVFVNPTQFNDARDLDAYPRTLRADVGIAREAGVDAVIAPPEAALYPQGYRYRVSEGEDAKCLEGAHRPGHFDGMLTIVLKLLGIARARRAYFGEKDFQQLRLVQGLAREFFLETEIVPVETVRESDGLAMSSRNVRLSPEQRTLAPYLYTVLRSAPTPHDAVARLAARGFAVDYVEEKWGRRLDNVVWPPKEKA